MGQRAPRRTGFLITNMSGGGAERVVSNLVHAMPERRPLLFLFEDEVVYPFDGEIQTLDTPLTNQSADLFKMVRGLIRLSRIKSASPLDTCVSFLTWPNIFNILTRRDERVIISVRNNPTLSIRGKSSPIIKQLVRTLYPRADHIVAISQDVRQDLIDQFGITPSKITTIYNPINLDSVCIDARRALPKELHDLADYPTVLSMGRLTLQKGQWHLLRAFRDVKNRIPDARLLLLGIGPYQNYLARLAHQLDLSVWIHEDRPDSQALDHDVIFWGFSSNPFAIMAASQVFAFTSLWEGLGNVILESLATGLPVVSADCPSGPREILAPGTLTARPIEAPEWAPFGVLMPVCSGHRPQNKTTLLAEEQIWADVLTHLLQDDELRQLYSRRGKIRATDFALDKIVSNWRTLLALEPQGTIHSP